LDTLRLPRLYRSINWECLAQHSELCHTNPSLKSSHSSPRELYILDQILRPHLRRRPLAVITTYTCKGDHWIHSGSLSFTAVLTGNALRNTWNLATRTLAQVEPSKPSGALQITQDRSPLGSTTQDRQTPSMGTAPSRGYS
jgi:hypothetical protein